jgi:hypothetical protein
LHFNLLDGLAYDPEPLGAVARQTIERKNRMEFYYGLSSHYSGRWSREENGCREKQAFVRTQ